MGDYVEGRCSVIREGGEGGFEPGGVRADRVGAERQDVHQERVPGLRGQLGAPDGSLPNVNPGGSFGLPRAAGGVIPL